jgi:UDP-N-acetylmuramoyl-L-alanyl-D-glutamate--2,6-diaminopimelate ligase
MMTLEALFPEFAGYSQSITGLTLDSREAGPGVLFLAVPGQRHDGRRFIDQATAAGAAAVVYDNTDGSSPVGSVPMLGVANLAAKLSAIAGRFYGEPSRRMGLVGITGTNGKTSVSQMLAQALTARGQTCGVIGTLGSGLVGELLDHGMTTPDALRVQQQLAAMREAGASWVSMEVSSHALDQHRVAALEFDVAVFTNLSRDHLDYHGDMQTYGAAKARLFQRPLQAAVINLDDDFGRGLAASCQTPVIGYSLARPDSALRCSDIRFDGRGIHAQLHYQGQQASLHSELLGEFNLSNLLAVVGSLLAIGIDLAEAASLVSGVTPPPGRMQRLGGVGAPLVVIDYAHTPDALEKALAALRVHAAGRLTCLFGCGGDRDNGKRPLMGSVAERMADRVVITDDNPRSEASCCIIEQICRGIEAPQRVTILANRAEAIAHTIARAQPEDVILIAGKGHETYQEVNGVRHSFSDIEQAMQALQKWEVAHA